MKDISRREALRGIIAGSAALTIGASKGVEAEGSQQLAAQLPLAFRGQHQPKPLPFDAAKLKGLSGKLINHIGKIITAAR